MQLNWDSEEMIKGSDAVPEPSENLPSDELELGVLGRSTGTKIYDGRQLANAKTIKTTKIAAKTLLFILFS